MIKEWHYVSAGQRMGPVSHQEIEQLILNSKINEDSYLWTKGFANWTKLKDLEEFSIPQVSRSEELPPILDIPKLSYEWDKLDENEKVVYVKIGIDRNVAETEYGPYSLNDLKRLAEDNRINGKSLVHLIGNADWEFLAEIPCSDFILNGSSVTISETDRRQNIRKPFVARMFFHNTEKVYEGMCRDISIGGMQVLVSNFPCEKNDIIEMNVHPENNEFCFVAKAQVVRILDGGQGFCVRFSNLNDKSSKSILKYLENN